MISCTNRDDLHKLFPLTASASFQTNGVQDGIVIRFKTFYLKIYDDRYTYAYNVKGYRYNNPTPVFEECVPVSRFNKFANQFTHENYLVEFQNPCSIHR